MTPTLTQLFRLAGRWRLRDGMGDALGTVRDRFQAARGLRLALLASTALVMAGVLPVARPVQAQDATWTGSFSGVYTGGVNWSTGAMPTGTAFFGASARTSITIGGAPPDGGINIGGWTFNPGASNYTTTNATSAFLKFTGAGIVVNGGSVTLNNNRDLYFVNSSSAGAATINNGSNLEFDDTSTAGSATINNNGYLVFNGSSTAGTANITHSNDIFNFQGSSSADHAQILNLSLLQFYDSSSAGSAAITNKNSLAFYGVSSA